MSQISLSDVQARRLWQRIVVKKIDNQCLCLKELDLEFSALREFPKRVDSGDPTNVEAQAARLYWNKLFGPEFRRDSDFDGINSFLNYGYAILRSSVARYAVASGLNPSLGVFHKNMENAFCLVDDLMEPFRPIVDYHCYPYKDHVELTTSIKKILVGVLEHQVRYNGEKKSLRNAIQEYCYSFCESIMAADFRKFDVEVEIFDGTFDRV